MRLIPKKIGIADVYKHRPDIIVPDILRISLLDIGEVFIRDTLLVRPVAFPDIRLQPGDGSMQKDQEIGLYQLGMDDIEELLIKPVFLFGQIDLGKKQALCKKIVADG